MKAVAYFRTSSATNVDGDSETRQRTAVEAYAARNGIDIAATFYDAAVSGADPVDARPGFIDLMAYCQEHDVDAILVESPDRFARDLMVQMTGYAMLKKSGLDLIPVSLPTHFTDPTPTGNLVRQILGAIAEFDKLNLVAKLKGARDRKRAATGRCEGRKPAPQAAIDLARHYRATAPEASLRDIARVLALSGHLSPSGRDYLPGSIKAMLK